MENAAIHNTAFVAPLGSPAEHPATLPNAERWYAVQTCARHEKRILEQLELRRVESFLPLYKKQSRWKDRRVTLELPLFPGYIFVRFHLSERLRVLQVPSIVRLVGFAGVATPLPDSDIEHLRQGLEAGIHAVPHPYLENGRRVRIVSGPMAGMVGILLRRKKRDRFVVSLDLIMRSLSVELSGWDVAAAS